MTLQACLLATQKWLLSLALAAVALLAPIHTLMGAVGFLIAADFLTGILAARKRGEPITSRAMGRTIYKALGYQLAVISGFALEALIPGGLPVAKLCAAAIGLVEFRSLAENVKTLTGVDLSSVVRKVRGDKE
jgi:hypothetical protein